MQAAENTLSSHQSASTLREVMTTEVVSVGPTTLIEDALDVMLRHEVSGLPVIDNGRLVGVVSEYDALQLLLSADGTEMIVPVAHYMSTDVVSVPECASLEAAAHILRNFGLRRLPVVRDGLIVGIVSRRDLMRVIRDRRREGTFDFEDDTDWQAWVHTLDAADPISV